MQHQSMTAGFSGGVAQATVLQKQALPNGMQTAMLQQRTMTNGGQTMLVQQRTMTNIIGGGVAQQTIVQQRMVPAPVATASPAAAMQAQAHAQAQAQAQAQAHAQAHAQALRQRALATQQASMMQQQVLRLEDLLTVPGNYPFFNPNPRRQAENRRIIGTGLQPESY